MKPVFQNYEGTQIRKLKEEEKYMAEMENIKQPKRHITRLSNTLPESVVYSDHYGTIQIFRFHTGIISYD
jgi:hypothetical protein